MSLPVEIVNQGIDWAAWTQAVGSVAAIIAAILISGRQRRHAERDREAAERAFGILCIGLAKQAVELVDATESGLTAKKISVSPETVDDVLETLDRLPFERMVSAEFALAFVNIRRSLFFYGEAYKLAVGGMAGGVDIDAMGNVRTELFNKAQSTKLQFARLEEEARRMGFALTARPDNETYRAIRAHNPGGVQEL